ncbi:pep a2 [Streptomyces sp. SID5785]|uniref:pep a2 n=1 Tax=Streptomyces sp. SID5785 TaxID=2690309 RepID=UPI0013610226|nr:pep a2 [Streptomyces sp. SID5785]MZD04301.1 pep a2 [Streptomyces sp. SID5785]
MDPRYVHIDAGVTPQDIALVGRDVSAQLHGWGLRVYARPVGRCVDILLRLSGEARAGEAGTAVEMWWNGRHLITAVSGAATGVLRGAAVLHPALARVAALSDGWGVCTGRSGTLTWFSRRTHEHQPEFLVPRPPGPVLHTARLPEPEALSPAPA